MQSFLFSRNLKKLALDAKVDFIGLMNPEIKTLQVLRLMTA